jgi:hypothetical protein
VDIKGIANIYSKGADLLREDSDSDANDFRKAVRRVWHRAHEEVVALSPSVAPHRALILDLWTTFGQKCGIDVDTPPNLAWEAPESTERWSRAKGCAWRECLCFGERPWHKLKKCTRCGQRFYCSTKCQKRYVVVCSKFSHTSWNIRAEIGTRAGTNMSVALPD